MIAYIRDVATFASQGLWSVSKYSLPEFSATGETGSVTVLGEQPDRTGDWLILGGGLWTITKSVVGSGVTTLTVALPSAAFSMASSALSLMT